MRKGQHQAPHQRIVKGKVVIAGQGTLQQFSKTMRNPKARIKFVQNAQEYGERLRIRGKHRTKDILNNFAEEAVSGAAAEIARNAASSAFNQFTHFPTIVKSFMASKKIGHKKFQLQRAEKYFRERYRKGYVTREDMRDARFD